jgi:hypothetical protein
MALKPQAVSQNVRFTNEIALHEKQIDSLLEEHTFGEEDLIVDRLTGTIEVWLDQQPSSEKVFEVLAQRYLEAGWKSVTYSKEEWTLLLTPPETADLRDSKNKKLGFVYLFKCNGLYKIGRSEDPKKRMQKMASAIMPFEIQKIHVIACDDAAAAERLLHRTFASKRKDGEWFDLSDFDVVLISSIKKM